MSLTYVYCLVRNARRPSLTGIPVGMPGGSPVEVQSVGDELWLIVSRVPEREYGEAALARALANLEWVGRRALAHEAVVEHFLKSRAVLPMQLFTLFTSDERAVSHVTRNRRRIDRVLARVERQLEWGVRLTFDERASTESTSASTRQRAPTLQSGVAYLRRKRDLIDEKRTRLLRARREGNRVYRAVAREATAARRRTETERADQESRLLVDAAFLVPARRASAFRAALRRQADGLGEAGVHLAVTGPWPPYNFVDAPRRRS